MALKANQQQQHESCLLVSLFFFFLNSETRVGNPESGGEAEKRGWEGERVRMGGAIWKSEEILSQ